MTSFPNPPDSKIRDHLQSAKTVAIVGMSDRPNRPSYEIAAFWLAKGKNIVPINPTRAGQQLLDQPVLGKLKEYNGDIDIVDIFRRSDTVPPIVDDAIAINAGTVWMQLGVVHEAAAKKASQAGLTVVMDDCPKIAWSRNGLP